jgi:hypothetical protein
MPRLGMNLTAAMWRAARTRTTAPATAGTHGWRRKVVAVGLANRFVCLCSLRDSGSWQQTCCAVDGAHAHGYQTRTIWAGFVGAGSRGHAQHNNAPPCGVHIAGYSAAETRRLQGRRREQRGRR